MISIEYEDEDKHDGEDEDEVGDGDGMEMGTSRRKDVLKSREAQQMMLRVTRFPENLFWISR